MGRTYESMMEELEVIEILSTAYDGDEFPGYENICSRQLRRFPFCKGRRTLQNFQEEL